ncbi:MAG: hypothetical protein ACK4MV_17800 [Beijerinckiaceae bacterium]
MTAANTGLDAQASDDEAAIRTLIGAWYAEHRKGPEGRPRTLLAPGAIDASPGYTYPRSGSAALGQPIYNSLAHRALEFRFDIRSLKIDPRFARAHVWERGYFYAWAAQQTYENAGSANFVFEKQDDGSWLVLAHQSNTVGIPPGMNTDPMPDLRDLFYATQGKDRDAERDAREAKAAR